MTLKLNRRRSLALLAASAPLAGMQSGAGKPIQLHLDLEVDPKREQEMLTNYRKTFEPAIRKQPGFVEVRLLKLSKEIAGKAPPNSRYRLIISFQTEAQRQKWVATDTHQQVWPTIEKTLVGSKHTVLLYDTL